ncbi:PKD domain-containing protein [Segetibacter sp. 3557_3]|uniref:PKD domain-containing protein n=1 Tax=Segetibacter sp. 3557_3 TaxID=2547429 RepID=UPI0010589D8B|nr:PKD domain-containing protein [Segetibacter sp. 3557_3]TDH18489.1 PKD domain-containing protein [Segetibacter sp. 3557_3]
MRSTATVVLDKPVILTMVVCIALGFLILGFRYKLYEPYVPVAIAVTEGKIQARDLVRFVAESKNGSNNYFDWDFGDRSPHGTGAMVTHTFKAAGKYNIVLLVNGKYREYKSIYVSDAAYTTEVRPSNVVRIVGNNRVDTSDYKKVKVQSPNSERRRLTVKIGPDAPVLNPGRDTIQRFDTSPTQPVIEVFIAPDISEVEMELMLTQVVSGHKDENDFSAFLCGNLNMRVVYNGRQIPFGQMCGELKGEMKKVKRIKDINVSFLKHPITNCIKQLSVTARKKWF